MKCVFDELAAYKKQLWLIVLTVFGTTMASLGLPSLLTVLIDDAIPNADMRQVIRIGGFMVVIVVVGLACGIATRYFSAIVSMGVGRSLRSKVFTKVQYFSQTEMDHYSASSLITRTNNDIS